MDCYYCAEPAVCEDQMSGKFFCGSCGGYVEETGGAIRPLEVVEVDE